MKDKTVRDIITTDYAKITDDMPVVEAAMELIQHVALGGPVVNSENKLVGWISEQECLQVTMQVAYYNQRVAIVKDIMRTDVLTVTKDETILSVAEKMSPNRPKNYPVVDENNKVVGLVTRRRLLKALISDIK